MSNNKVISEKMICACCKADNHKWYEIYYGDCVTLKKLEKTFIAWCESLNKYVLITNND